MNDQPLMEEDPEIQTQLILLAASKHDVEALRTLLRSGSANVQDPETGFTPLHVAIAACELPSPAAVDKHDSEETHENGYVSDKVGTAQHDGEEADMLASAKTVRLLLQNGAIWNDVDRNDETPGCLALRLGLKELYEIMVDAGVRAEMLLNRLDEYEPLDDASDADGDDEADRDKEVIDIHRQENTADEKDPNLSNASPAGEPRNEDYLQSSLRFQDGRILDDMDNGVMMAWETDIMKRTSDLLCPKPGLRVLNIGHGMGIIDGFFQEMLPSHHHIVEAHPAVLARMKGNGWYEKPNVTIHEGRWQEIVPKVIEQGILFDAIYFDTFAEDYKALRDFFSDCLIGLLEDGGKWGFFNGLGADRQICYDVYAKVVEMDLFEAGFDIEWDTMHVPEANKGEWDGIKRRYWTLQAYKLPICSFIG
ncbi:MAG: hypothetical protein Q9163_001027 [Psora crenata]